MSEENKHLHVSFYLATKQNKAKSEAEGRPVHDEIEMVRIMWPGDRNQSLSAPAQSRSIRVGSKYPTYAERFPDQYKAFKDNVEFIGEGTPLAELPFLSEAQRKDLRALNIFTAETLVSLEGSTLQRLGMLGREWKNKAKAYLDSASGVNNVVQLSSENAEMKSQIEELKAEMAKMRGDINVDPAPQTPFDDWADEDIRNWMKDAGGSPHHLWKRETLVEKAMELNNAKNTEAA